VPAILLSKESKEVNRPTPGNELANAASDTLEHIGEFRHIAQHHVGGAATTVHSTRLFLLLSFPLKGPGILPTTLFK